MWTLYSYKHPGNAGVVHIGLFRHYEIIFTTFLICWSHSWGVRSL